MNFISKKKSDILQDPHVKSHLLLMLGGPCKSIILTFRYQVTYFLKILLMLPLNINQKFSYGGIMPDMMVKIYASWIVHLQILVLKRTTFKCLLPHCTL